MPRRRNLAGLAVRDPVRTGSPFHNSDDSTPRRQSTQNHMSCGTDSGTRIPPTHLGCSQYSATGLFVCVCQGAMQQRQFRRRERHQLGAQRRRHPPAEFGVLVGAEDIEPAPLSHSGPAWVAGHRTGDCPPAGRGSVVSSNSHPGEISQSNPPSDGACGRSWVSCEMEEAVPILGLMMAGDVRGGFFLVPFIRPPPLWARPPRWDLERLRPRWSTCSCSPPVLDFYRHPSARNGVFQRLAGFFINLPRLAVLFEKVG